MTGDAQAFPLPDDFSDFHHRLSMLLKVSNLQAALEVLTTHLQTLNPQAGLSQQLELRLLQASLLHQHLRSEEALVVLQQATQQAKAAGLWEQQQHLLRQSIEVLQGLKRFEEARTTQWHLLTRLQAEQVLDHALLLDVSATQILDTSLEAFLQDLPLHVQLDGSQEALLYKDLGNVMCALKRYPEGLKLFQLGLQVLPAEAPIQQRVDLLNGVGGVYTWIERFREALLAYQENHRLFTEMGDQTGQIQQLINMAWALQSIPRPQEARTTLEQVIELSRQLGLPRFTRQAHYMLTGLKGMPRKEAARHLLEYARLELEFSADPQHDHEPLLLHTEVRQNQQNFDFQKSMRLELEGAYQKLYDLSEERQMLYERLEKQSEEFERLANTDPLTGLPNRRLFFAHFEREHARIRRTGEDFSVVLMDIDHFKSINDTHSHKTGDLVLKIVSEILRQERRASDLVARYGGEEFVLLLSGADALGARLACERIQHRLHAYPWQRLLENRSITMSFGICARTDLESIDQILMQADECLYQAKNAGRNRIVG
ncbi:GGDEF domain-containing protein [Deinococcus roseus]|uniref:GGDEF domain-containing protein n=1 Tax=Deinococcus roseus TaxID=392414 RepID=A0ABQ2CWH4_9DEIO|nr:GGDEF domain-containing protein [Deinococcus roseus]GGJ27721.1 hypothetical protein GCM10008938_12240 [Deinococcus roseus]